MLQENENSQKTKSRRISRRLNLSLGVLFVPEVLCSSSDRRRVARLSERPLTRADHLEEHGASFRRLFRESLPIFSDACCAGFQMPSFRVETISSLGLKCPLCGLGRSSEILFKKSLGRYAAKGLLETRRPCVLLTVLSRCTVSWRMHRGRARPCKHRKRFCVAWTMSGSC